MFALNAYKKAVLHIDFVYFTCEFRGRRFKVKCIRIVWDCLFSWRPIEKYFYATEFSPREFTECLGKSFAMRYLILFVAVCHAANAGDLLTVQPAVVQYSPPYSHVASPYVHAQTPYVGSYAVHTTPAIHHNYHHTQTHPIGYVKPVILASNCVS